MPAPARRPLAAPLAEADAAAQGDAATTGPRDSTCPQSQPIWVSAYVNRAIEVASTAERTAATTSPALPLRGPLRSAVLISPPELEELV
jgi:hypothetical protein